MPVMPATTTRAVRVTSVQRSTMDRSNLEQDRAFLNEAFQSSRLVKLKTMGRSKSEQDRAFMEAVFQLDNACLLDIGRLSRRSSRMEDTYTKSLKEIMKKIEGKEEKIIMNGILLKISTNLEEQAKGAIEARYYRMQLNCPRRLDDLEKGRERLERIQKKSHKEVEESRKKVNSDTTSTTSTSSTPHHNLGTKNFDRKRPWR